MADKKWYKEVEGDIVTEILPSDMDNLSRQLASQGLTLEDAALVTRGELEILYIKTPDEVYTLYKKKEKQEVNTRQWMPGYEHNCTNCHNTGAEGCFGGGIVCIFDDKPADSEYCTCDKWS